MESLIRKIEALRPKDPFVSDEIDVDLALEEAIKIIRQHEAEPPQAMQDQEKSAGDAGATRSGPVERVAFALWREDAVGLKSPRMREQWLVESEETRGRWTRKANAAIAALEDGDTVKTAGNLNMSGERAHGLNTSQKLTDCRTAFERWCESESYDYHTKDEQGRYAYAEAAWLAYQDAWKSRPSEISATKNKPAGALPMERRAGSDSEHVSGDAEKVKNESREIPVIAKPTEAMCDAARAFILCLDMGIRRFGDMRRNLERGGNPVLPYIKQRAEEGEGAHITKWDIADIIWQYMAATAPKRESGDDGKPYLSNRADGIDGHYCIGIIKAGTAWYWNKGQWQAFGEVFDLTVNPKPPMTQAEIKAFDDYRESVAKTFKPTPTA